MLQDGKDQLNQSLILASRIDRAVFKTLKVKNCVGQPHLCQNNVAQVADLSIWDKPLTITKMIEYTSCRLKKSQK